MAEASSRRKEPPERSPFALNVDSLRAAGYGDFLLMLVPPHEPIGERVSTGKEPGAFRNRRWHFQEKWQKYRMSDADVERLKPVPRAGLGLRCGQVVALDLDFYAIEGEAASIQSDLSLEIMKALARRGGVGIDALPIRTRDNSNSLMVFFRAEERTYKRSLKFTIEGEDSGIELMAEGQQVVVAAHHKSGTEVITTLADYPFADLPVLDDAAVDGLWLEIGKLVEAAGGIISVSQGGLAGARQRQEPFDEGGAVLGELMRRRDVWLDEINFIHHRTGNAGETRTYLEDLARNLEESIAFYPDGIFDFGSKHAHTPVSFLCEFCTIDDEDRLMADCPMEYERDDGEGEYWRVVNDHVRRPTEAQALNWLARLLSDKDGVAPFPVEVTWSSVLPTLARLLGLAWERLREAWASHWIIIPDEPVWDPSQWGPDTVRQQEPLLPALRAVMPTRFAAWRVVWEQQGVDVEALIDAEMKRVREAAANDNDAEKTAAGIWPAPKDLFGDGDDAPLWDIDRDVLPPVLYDHACDVTARLGIAPTWAIVSGLAVLAAAIGSKWYLQPRREDRTWKVPCIFWGLLSGPSGGYKSPVITIMTTPLAGLNNDWVEHDNLVRRIFLARQKKLGKAARVEREPPLRRCVTQNFTIESLVRILKDNPCGVLILQTELTALICNLDAYKSNRGGDRGDFLRLADGGIHSVDRVGTGVTNLRYWGASILAGIQPDKIRQMAPELAADGLLQRFVIVTDETLRPPSRKAPDLQAARKWHDIVHEIAKAQQPDPEKFLLDERVTDLNAETKAKIQETEREQFRRLRDSNMLFEPSVVQLSASADLEWSVLHQEIQDLQGLPGLSGAWANHLSKWAGISASLLLLLHVVERWRETEGAPEAQQVSVDTVRRCIKLVHWLLLHTLRFYERNIGLGAAADDARRIAGFLLANEGAAIKCRRTNVITRHQVGSALGENQPATEAARNIAAMTFLAQYEWCQPDDGRLPDHRGPLQWKLNPLLFDGRFADHAVKEKARRAELRLKIRKAAEQKRRMQKI